MTYHGEVAVSFLLQFLIISPYSSNKTAVTDIMAEI